MRRLVQISDLHFGKSDPALLKPLREAIEEIAPDVLIISGDLVEHATVQEFQDAARFLDTLPKPNLIVPGNHDLPFYNLWERAFIGLKRYRDAITSGTYPRYEDSEMVILGANTSRVWPIRGGSLSSLQLEKLVSDFAAVPKEKMRLLVTHHPFDLPMAQNRRLIVGHARRSINRLAPVVDILMAGHIHISSTGSTSVRYRAAGHALAFIQAGTAVSTRDKGERNSFNSLRVKGSAEGGKSVVVDTWTWHGQSSRFAIRCSNDFRLESEGWASVPHISPEEQIHEDEGIVKS